MANNSFAKLHFDCKECLGYLFRGSVHIVWQHSFAEARGPPVAWLAFVCQHALMAFVAVLKACFEKPMILSELHLSHCLLGRFC
jgi:hypothetical protein